MPCQLCTLPLRNTVIDCVAQSAVDQVFMASSSGIEERDQPDPCASCKACCASCQACLQCCWDCYTCKCCNCCKCDCCTCKVRAKPFLVTA